MFLYKCGGGVKVKSKVNTYRYLKNLPKYCFCISLLLTSENEGGAIEQQFKGVCGITLYS